MFPPDYLVSSAVTYVVALVAASRLSVASLSFLAVPAAAVGVATEPAVAVVVTHSVSFVPLSASVARAAAAVVPVFVELLVAPVFFLVLLLVFSLLPLVASRRDE